VIFSLYPSACDLCSMNVSVTLKRKTKRICADDGGVGVGVGDCERGKESDASDDVF